MDAGEQHAAVVAGLVAVEERQNKLLGAPIRHPLLGAVALSILGHPGPLNSTTTCADGSNGDDDDEAQEEAAEAGWPERRHC